MDEMWGPIHVLDDLIFHISFVSIFLIQNDWSLWGWWMMFDVGTDIFQPIERETTITLFFSFLTLRADAGNKETIRGRRSLQIERGACQCQCDRACSQTTPTFPIIFTSIL
jgi:hypothetical protein